MFGSTSDTDRAALDETEAALGGPITALTPTAAHALIDRWRAACLGADGLDLSGVAAGLSDLRTLLSADRLDGHALAGTMASLAEATRTAAEIAPDEPLRPRLERIASALDRAASALDPAPRRASSGRAQA